MPNAPSDWTAAINTTNSRNPGPAGAPFEAVAEVIAAVQQQPARAVYIFADTLNNNGSADTAVLVSGRTVNDVAFGNFTLRRRTIAQRLRA